MKDKKIGILLLGFALVFACGRKTESKNIELTQSNFKLAQDYNDFASKMENNDTLNLGVNLSMCGWEEYDEVEITKSEDRVYIQIKEKRIASDTTIYFPKVPYELKNDTLSIEKMMEGFDINYTEKISSPFFIIRNPKEKDTILLRTTGLGNRGRNIQKYHSLMLELYPKEMDSYYVALFGVTYKEFNEGIITEE